MSTICASIIAGKEVAMLSILAQLEAASHVDKRRCSCCKEWKEYSEFSVKDKARGYLDTRCKGCKRELANARNRAKKTAELVAVDVKSLTINPHNRIEW